MMKIVTKDAYLVNVEYPKNLQDSHSYLSFLSEKMKIKKWAKLICKLFNKEKYVVHVRTLKQAFNHGLVLKKAYKVLEFNQKAWLKPYIEVNTESRKK